MRATLAPSTDGADTITVQRSVFEHAGFWVDFGTTAMVSDSVFENYDDFAFEAYGAAELHLERCAVDRDAIVALLVQGAHVVLTDVVVRDTTSEPRAGMDHGYWGDALDLQYGARGDLTRVYFARNRNVAIYAQHAGTIANLTDVTITSTLDQECDPAACAWRTTSGIGSYDGASVIASRFEISNGTLCGVQLARDGTVDLADGTVFGNKIGANVQTAGFDVGRLEHDVIWRDNEVNFAGDSLPVPQPKN